MGPAAGHDFESGLRPVFEGIEPSAPGVHVEVRVIVAPAVFVRNEGTAVLEIIGGDGRPFIRVGPRGVEGNVVSPDLYRTNAPVLGSPVPSGARSGARPRWIRIGSEPAWSWFEHRIRPLGAYPGAGWTIPARLGGRKVRLKGLWVLARRNGVFRTVVDGIRPAIDGVNVEALSDGPALLVQNTTGELLEITDARSRAFLRVGPAGVEQRKPGGSWTRMGTTPAWAWLEPRAGWDAEEPPADVAAARTVTPLRDWSVEGRIGGRSLAITGRVEWVPVAAHHVAGSGGRSLRGLFVVLAVSIALVVGTVFVVARRRRARRAASTTTKED